LLYQMQEISRLAVSNTSDVFSRCCIKYKQLPVSSRRVIKRLPGNLKHGEVSKRHNTINKTRTSKSGRRRTTMEIVINKVELSKKLILIYVCIFHVFETPSSNCE
jgi:NADH:ubiquinone oxidoreductase subunit D